MQQGVANRGSQRVEIQEDALCSVQFFCKLKANNVHRNLQKKSKIY